ncbi:hypothetical protein MNQ96_10495 [Sphingopyxis granuli]|uniref:hypothetical protein n=1 Tax=Sphingopyxis granuli TaxID=267128 RepID=UPI001F537F7D|nr:hypothetical protein [Sphingopyxis granuli]UNK78019.1 hypothetical protein MNQ96_10495 [Sphingopyxis granuli]
MRTIRFGTGKLVIGTLAGIVLPAMGLPMLFGGGLLAVLGVVLIVAGPLASASSIKRLLGDGVALEYDAAGVRVATSWSSERFRWSQVRSIGRSQLVTRMYGFIPVNRQNFIDFKVEGGVFGTRTIRLAASVLDVKKRDLDSLVGDLQAAHAGQVPATAMESAASARPDRGRDPLEGAPRGDTFDADAALARYLAHRPAPQPAAPAATPGLRPRPTFGRKVA